MITNHLKFDKAAVENAKNQADCREIIKNYTTKYKEYGDKLRCCCPFPNHDDSTPSMDVFKTYFHCFGCAATGDVITLITSLKKGYFENDVQGKDFVDACAALGVTAVEKAPEVVIPEQPLEENELESIYQLALYAKNKAYSYLENRNITKKPLNIGCLTVATTTKYHQKYLYLANYNWLCTPMYSVHDGKITGEIIGLNLRNIDNEDKLIKHRKLGKTGVYQPLYQDDETFLPLDQTIGCESATDAISLSTPSTAVFGVFNYKHYTFKAIASDNDDSGIEAALNANTNLVFSNGTDPAASDKFITIEVDLEDLEEKLVAILLFEKDVLKIDNLIKSAYLASYYNDEVAAVYRLIEGLQDRSLSTFFESFYRIKDEKFNNKTLEERKKNYLRVSYLFSTVKDTYQSIKENNMVKIIENIKAVIPRRLGKSLSDKDWRSFERNLYGAENSLEMQSSKPLTSYKVKGFTDLFRSASLQVLAGHSNVGKTTLTYYLINSIITENENTKVMFFSLETNKDLVLEAMKEYELFDENRLTVIENIINVGHLPQLINIAAEEGYTHFFIDNAKIVYQEDSAAMEKAVRLLELVAAKKGVSIMMLAQLLKNTQSEKYYYVRRYEIHGGGALFDRADLVLAIQEYKPNMDTAQQKIPAECKQLHISVAKTRIPRDNTIPNPLFSFEKDRSDNKKFAVKVERLHIDTITDKPKVSTKVEKQEVDIDKS